MSDTDMMKSLIEGKILRGIRWPAWCHRDPDMGTLYECRVFDGQLQQRYACGLNNQLMSMWHATRELPPGDCQIVETAGE